MVDCVQKVTKPDLECDKMELGDSSQAKTLNTEFDADISVFPGASTLVVNTVYRESAKIVCQITWNQRR